MRRLLPIVSLLALGVLAVDRSNFKTCEQSGFCRRNRRMQPGRSPFVVLTKTATQVDAEHITVDLLNSHNQQQFVLYIEAIAGPSVRVTIDEKNSPIKRYMALPALKPGMKNIPIKLSSTTDEVIEATFGDSHRIVIRADPMKIDVYSGDTLIITANERGLMKFEHYRQREMTKPIENVGEAEGEKEEDTSKVSYNERGEKIIDGEAKKLEEAKEAVEGEADQAADESGEDLDGAWDETFKGHTDSKPRGPMSVGMDFTFEGFDFIYGLPEHADRFVLSPTKGKTDPFRFYNLDVFEYEIFNPMALYGATPLIVAHNEKQTVGILWLNPSETWVDIESPNGGMLSSMVDFVSNKKAEHKRETHWFSETGLIDVFFMVGPTPQDFAKQNSEILGNTPLPPMFSLAHHQSRWNYNDQDDVRMVDQGFDEHDIPYDVIWLDIEHTDGKRYFTWDPIKFSNPLDMIQNLTAKTRRMVTIVDPHIKRDSNYFVHSEATNLGYYVKDKNGNDYDGWCWPGSSSYLDFSNPVVRDYWAGKFAIDQYKGSTEQLFTWNDMNEPSVFNGPEVTMPKDCKHVDDYEHRDVHNIYGMLQVMSTFEGQLRRSNNKLRPFILSRSFFAGTQRYGAVWTGDNQANWDHLRVTIPMLLSLSVTGVTFVGADVPGFFGNPEPEMIVRWYQMGVYQPFFRAHAHHDTKRREPWLFDDNSKRMVRDVLLQRYRLLPLWYTLFYENERDSQPPMRPLWWNFPQDKESFALDDCHLLGDTLLVRPVLEKGVTSVNIYFPGKTTVWYDIKTHQKFAGAQTLSHPVTLESLPVYQRGGSILFTKERVRRASALQANDPYTLTVALDKDGVFANGTVYMDDEVSYEYREGKKIYAGATFKDDVLSYRIIEGNYNTPAWVERIIVLGLPKVPEAVKDGTKDLEFSHSVDKLTIRKPAFHMNEAWNLRFVF